MVGVIYIPTRISNGDAAYIRSGIWKCEPSPTGAHHWIEVEKRNDAFTCKYCGGNVRFPRHINHKGGKIW